MKSRYEVGPRNGSSGASPSQNRFLRRDAPVGCLRFACTQIEAGRASRPVVGVNNRLKDRPPRRAWEDLNWFQRYLGVHRASSEVGIASMSEVNAAF